MVVGASYAYFTVIRVSKVLPDSTVQAATTELMTFFTGENISITADSGNFGWKNGSLSSDTFAQVSLFKGDATVQMDHSYNITLDIKENDFEYTTEERRPELILSVIGPDGEVTSIEGLEYTAIIDNAGDVIRGFDITDKGGLFYLANEFPIATEDQTIHDWRIAITLVNLNSNQENNISKTFEGTFLVDKVI